MSEIELTPRQARSLVAGPMKGRAGEVEWTLRHPSRRELIVLELEPGDLIAEPYYGDANSRWILPLTGGAVPHPGLERHPEELDRG